MLCLVLQYWLEIENCELKTDDWKLSWSRIFIFILSARYIFAFKMIIYKQSWKANFIEHKQKMAVLTSFHHGSYISASQYYLNKSQNNTESHRITWNFIPIKPGHIFLVNANLFITKIEYLPSLFYAAQFR